MQAIVLKAFGEVGNLIQENLPLPFIHADEVLVKVKAIGINPVDAKTRKGEAQANRIKKEYPIILGWDISGVITKTGNQVEQFHIGDEVFGTVHFPGHGKAYAEYVAAPASQLALKPKNIAHTEAAAASLAALTAWQALINDGHIQAGDQVLIHGASGGVGHYAVQIAKYFGAYVTGIASEANKNFVLRLGADRFIDYQSELFEKIVEKQDFILDSIGGENFARSISVLKATGTIVHLPSNKAPQAQKIAEEKKLRHFYQMSVTSSGEDMKFIAGLLELRKLKSYISHVFTFDQIPQAHLQIESGKTTGKIVIELK